MIHDDAGPRPPSEAAARTVIGLLETVAVAANEAVTVEQAVQSCLDAVCAYWAWPVGHVFLPEAGAHAAQHWVSARIWHLDDEPRYESFRRVTEALRPPGDGLLARLVDTGRPVWSNDLSSQPGEARTRSAAEAGLRSVFAFPVLVGTEVVAALEFFSPASEPPDPALLDVTSQIGAQLGRTVERTRLLGALRDSEERMRMVVETAGDAFVGMDSEGAITDWNAAAEVTFGWSRQHAIGRRLADTIIPLRYRAAHDQGLAHFLATGEGPVLERRVELEALHHDGHELPVEVSIWPVRQGRTVQFNAFVHDITERRRAETALRDAKERFQTAFDNAPIGMALGDLSGRLVETNRAYGEMLGYPQEGLEAMTFADMTHPDDVESSAELFRRALAGELATYRTEKRYIRADGETVWVLLNVSAVTGADGEIAYFIGQIQDITARMEADAELTRRALHDPLTGLPNRSLFLDRLHQALARSERSQGSVTVMFLDLDHFKAINDTRGHDAGDDVLRAVAGRLEAVVRPSDTVCRLGGDEFLVLCEGLSGRAKATDIAARLGEAVSHPCRLTDGDIIVTASVGVAMADGDRTSPEALIRDADAAMYRAKEGGTASRAVLGEDAGAPGGGPNGSVR